MTGRAPRSARGPGRPYERILSPRRAFIYLFFLITLLVALKDSGAVMDIYSGRKAFSIVEAFARKIRRSDSFSRSIAHYTMGIIYDNASRPADAIREYEAAVKTDPGVSYFHTRLAADHFLQKSHDRALEETRRAVSLDPADVRPRFMAEIGRAHV